MTTSISEQALLKRINRKLAREDEAIRIMRPHRASGQVYYRYNGLGRYHRVDTFRNMLLDGDVNIVDLGRKLKVLGEREDVELGPKGWRP